MSVIWLPRVELKTRKVNMDTAWKEPKEGMKCNMAFPFLEFITKNKAINKFKNSTVTGTAADYMFKQIWIQKMS